MHLILATEPAGSLLNAVSIREQVNFKVGCLASKLVVFKQPFLLFSKPKKMFRAERLVALSISRKDLLKPVCGQNCALRQVYGSKSSQQTIFRQSSQKAISRALIERYLAGLDYLLWRSSGGLIIILHSHYKFVLIIESQGKNS